MQRQGIESLTLHVDDPSGARDMKDAPEIRRPSAGQACWNITIQPLQTNQFNPFTAIQSLSFEGQTPGQGL